MRISDFRPSGAPARQLPVDIFECQGIESVCHKTKRTRRKSFNVDERQTGVISFKMADAEPQSAVPTDMLTAADVMAEKHDIGSEPVSRETATAAGVKQAEFSRSPVEQMGRGLVKTLSKAQQAVAELTSDTINILSLGSTRDGAGSSDISGPQQVCSAVCTCRCSAFAVLRSCRLSCCS